MIWNGVEFDVIINNTSIDVDPASISFSVRDSIHNLLPELNFELMDSSGIVQDSCLTSEGIDIKIKYGIADQSLLDCKFVIESDQLPRTLAKDSIGGKLFINGIHEFYSYQEVKSDSYIGRISEVIRKILYNSKYVFKNNNVIPSNNTYINDTGCDYIWYRPMLNEKDFIEQILLPNSYSNNCFDTPFFCYIDSNNNFNFRNYHSLSFETVSKSLKYLEYSHSVDKKQAAAVGAYAGSSSIGDRFIIDYKRWKQGSFYNKKYWNRKIFSRNRNDGSFDETIDYISSYPKGMLNYIPIIKDDHTSGFVDLEYSEMDVPLQECFNGRRINSTKDGFFLERLLLTIPLDTNLHAGNMLELTFPIKVVNTNRTENSQVYTGEYLVESTDHVWNGTIKNAYTNLIVSRKFIDIPDSSLLRSRFING